MRAPGTPGAISASTASLHEALPPELLSTLERATLFQARLNLGQTWPNPSVGVVIADPNTGEIIASAVTARGGRPHAEVQALREAGERARGAILLTTLEPCSHYGATPPCSDSIIEAGISLVIYGSRDPDPRVSGRGLSRLVSHNVAVMRGPFVGECDWINRGHALRVTAGRPFTQLKLAVDADGRVPLGDGAPVWITGNEAQARAQRLRAGVDAILAGRNTVVQDNPKLTCRLPGLEDRSPVRIVLASKADIPLDAQMLNGSGPPVWVVCAADAPASARAALEEKGAKVFQIQETVKGRPNLRSALRRLTGEGLTRLLVEGGPSVARAFLDADAADEIIIMQSVKRLDGEPSMPAFQDQGLERLNSPRYEVVSQGSAGEDTVTVYRPVRR